MGDAPTTPDDFFYFELPVWFLVRLALIEKDGLPAALVSKVTEQHGRIIYAFTDDDIGRRYCQHCDDNAGQRWTALAEVRDAATFVRLIEDAAKRGVQHAAFDFTPDATGAIACNYPMHTLAAWSRHKWLSGKG